MTDDSDDGPNWHFSRRRMMRDVGLTTGGVAVGGIVGYGLHPDEEAPEFEPAPRVEDVSEEAFAFLTLPQAAAVERLVDRIYPDDELGPGAVEAGVLFFIDGQLAGAWGEGAKHYTDGPFHPEEAVPEQGWQYRHTPNEVYEHALEALDAHAQREYGTGVADLSAEQADEVVAALEADEVDAFESVAPSDFFAMLRQNVLEGMFADPLYGGNRDMAGWRMKDFPGTPHSLLSYKDRIEDEAFHEIEPASLSSNVRARGTIESLTRDDAADGGESAHGHGAGEPDGGDGGSGG